MLEFSLVSWFILGVLGVISWFTYKVYIWPYYLSPLRNIPGPPSESLIYGNFKRFFTEEVSYYVLNNFFFFYYLIGTFF